MVVLLALLAPPTDEDMMLGGSQVAPDMHTALTVEPSDAAVSAFGSHAVAVNWETRKPVPKP